MGGPTQAPRDDPQQTTTQGLETNVLSAKAGVDTLGNLHFWSSLFSGFLLHLPKPLVRPARSAPFKKKIRCGPEVFRVIEFSLFGKEEPEPNQPRHGWQQRATRQLEMKFLSDMVWPISVAYLES